MEGYVVRAWCKLEVFVEEKLLLRGRMAYEFGADDQAHGHVKTVLIKLDQEMLGASSRK